MSTSITGNHIPVETSVGLAPAHGQVQITQSVTLVSGTSQLLNFVESLNKSKIDFIQTIYADNSQNSSPLVVVCNLTQQTLTWPPFSQGYIGCMVPREASFFTVTSSNSVTVNMHFMAMMVPYAIWYPAGNSGAATGVSFDGSTTITAGGTAQNLFGGVTPNKYGIYNPHATQDLWVSDSTTAAPNAAGSIRVPANGGWYETPSWYVPLGAVSIYGAVTGQPVTARRS